MATAICGTCSRCEGAGCATYNTCAKPACGCNTYNSFCSTCGCSFWNSYGIWEDVTSCSKHEAADHKSKYKCQSIYY